VQIGRLLLVTVLVAGMVSTVRLGWVTRDYVAALDALQRIEFVVTGVARPSPDQLVLQIEIRNQSSSWVDVQSLHLNAYGTGPTSLGATYEPFSAIRVEPRATMRVTRTVTLTRPDQVEEPSGPLRFSGQTLLRLPIGERYFAHQLQLSWEDVV
jgi:hypothetical protein